MILEKLIFRVHAIQRMFQRNISVKDVRRALKSGEVIETYPNDTPYPSQLILGYCHSEPLHIVIANNSQDNETIVITVYQPDTSIWNPEFKRRRKL